jgi:hypothetical protein
MGGVRHQDLVVDELIQNVELVAERLFLVASLARGADAAAVDLFHLGAEDRMSVNLRPDGPGTHGFSLAGWHQHHRRCNTQQASYGCWKLAAGGAQTAAEAAPDLAVPPSA